MDPNLCFSDVSPEKDPTNVTPNLKRQEISIISQTVLGFAKILYQVFNQKSNISTWTPAFLIRFFRKIIICYAIHFNFIAPNSYCMSTIVSLGSLCICPKKFWEKHLRLTHRDGVVTSATCLSHLGLLLFVQMNFRRNVCFLC